MKRGRKPSSMWDRKFAKGKFTLLRGRDFMGTLDQAVRYVQREAERRDLRVSIKQGLLDKVEALEVEVLKKPGMYRIPTLLDLLGVG